MLKKVNTNKFTIILEHLNLLMFAFLSVENLMYLGGRQEFYSSTIAISDSLISRVLNDKAFIFDRCVLLEYRCLQRKLNLKLSSSRIPEKTLRRFSQRLPESFSEPQTLRNPRLSTCIFLISSCLSRKIPTAGNTANPRKIIHSIQPLACSER